MWVQGGVSGVIAPFRSYDARSGRWRSHDPIFQPWESTYLGMGGNPAMMVDPWGLKGTGLTYQKSAASPLSAAQYGTRGIPFFGSTPRSDQTNVAINYARDTQKTAPSQESRTSQALQKRQAERNSKKKNKKRKPRNSVEEFEAGVEAGFEGEINSGLDAVAVIPEMLTDATIEIANNSDLLLEIVLETGAGAALSLGEELVDVVNPIGYILDSPYENGQKFGSLMGKFVVALYTGGLAIIARVALQMPKLAKLAKMRSKLQRSVVDVMGEGYTVAGEVTSPINNTLLLNELAAASPGNWVKVYEAGILKGNKVEIHYFRNNTTQEVFDVKIKFNYWHQKSFKQL